ncbi:MAG: prolyl oligopeptidase family serine peptidase [Acidobacteria bacterium]|nr:prolyl oligopeptidase family serine peptidase [Acidobacteriota bacterium]
MKHFFVIILVALFVVSAFSQKEINIEINGVKRFAIVHEGDAKSKKSPVVFVFHGHGGNARFAERRLNFHDEWNEALVVYMQGIPGVAGITDEAGTKNGWQKNPGELGDRDLKFFDEVLKSLIKDYKVDESRIYAVGHSNGARFVNVLWAERGDKFAAFCSVAAQGGLMIRNAVPRSIWMSIGENDPLVPARGQKLSIPIVQKLLNIDSEKGDTKGEITTYKGISGTELVTEIRDAGHEFPVMSIPKIVEFFKRNVKGGKGEK